jgi:hypothetical protein
MYKFDYLASGKDKNYPRQAEQKGQTPTMIDISPSSHLHRALGNQAMHRLYLKGSSCAEHNHMEAMRDSTLNSTLRTTKGSGESLSEPIKTFMEASLNTNLDQVRVHTGHRAEAMTKTLGAEAFTYGKNIYFNSGRYNSDTAKGTKLLAHELVHTIQQGFHDDQISDDLSISSPEELAEQEADGVDSRIVGNISIGKNQTSLINSIKAQRIQPKIQMATNIDVAISETKDHGTGYEDAPDEPFKLEANSLNEAGTKLNKLIKAARGVFDSATAIKQLSFYGHGAPGSQSVGAGEGWDSAKEISVASIGQYSDAYKQIYTPLSNGANVYLRGCNVGAGEEGLKLLKEVKSSCKTLVGKDIEAYGWTGKSYHMRLLAYDWYKQTGERVSSGDKVPKINWEELKKRGTGKK